MIGFPFFIRVTLANGNSSWINANRIISFRLSVAQEKNEGGSTLRIAGWQSLLLIREAPSTLLLHLVEQLGEAARLVQEVES